MVDHDATLGTVALSIAEPWPGYERAYNRWYERHHFYTGAMAGPGAFAGRRWVATARHKQLRYPAENRLIDNVSAGSFFVTYWIQAGALDRWQRWAMEEVRPQFVAANQMFPQRDFIFTQYYDLLTTTYRDADGVPVAVALDHPFPGVAAIVVETVADLSADEFSRRLSIDVLGELLPGSPIAMCLHLTPVATPEEVVAPAPVDAEFAARRVMLLCFLDVDPLECWDNTFADLGVTLTSKGIGEVLLATAFVPTIPGTDAYIDELH